MDNFNLKQYLFESRAGMYSKAVLKEHELENPSLLGKEIAAAHPELVQLIRNNEAKKYQDIIFQSAGEILQDAGVKLQTVRGLAYDHDWAADLVSATLDALGRENLKEINPAALGAQQDAADAKMQQQDDENGDMVDNVSMDTVAEQLGVAYVNKQIPVETGLTKYLDVLNAHDWFHHFSDDPRAFRKGQLDKDVLRALYDSMTPNDKQKAMDAFIDKYLHMHDPKQFPGAANNVKYLTTDTFKGAI